MGEEWRNVKGYEGLYQVSNYGRVTSFYQPARILKPNPSRAGYLTVELFQQGRSKRILTHRLVAIAFIENPFNLPQVNHKDENKSNNHATNLEWCTASYNVRYGQGYILRRLNTNYPAIAEKLKTSQRGAGNNNAKAVVQWHPNGQRLSQFATIRDATKCTNINGSHISETCKGKRKSAGGFLWAYERRNDLSVSLS